MTRWQISLRVIGVALLLVGGALVAWDLITSLRILEPSPGGSNMSVAATVAVRHGPLFSCMAGAAFLVLSFVLRKPE
jgi:hypothetical protein